MDEVDNKSHPGFRVYTTERKDGSLWMAVEIPTHNQFLIKNHAWVHKEVSKKFKRDKHRMIDTVQNVRVRLMQKDFIGRWFFKHLTHELVTRDEAERILGRDKEKLKFMSVINPVVGSRSEPDSLWLISDLLEYAQFDHERFYYSIQGHTIPSDLVLKLLGYAPGQYNALKSLYKQGRLRPAEFTQHECSESSNRAQPIDGKCSVEGCGKRHLSRGYCVTHYGQIMKHTCSICEKGRASLKAKKVSLADDWMKSPEAVKSLRWNDSQLRPFLRFWHRQNLVSCAPLTIMRPIYQTGPYVGIEAGLLKYASILIGNEVINDFKRMRRTDDIGSSVLNDGVSGETENADVVAWESDEAGERSMIIKDSSSLDEFKAREFASDISAMMSKANLSDAEKEIIFGVDLEDVNIKDYVENWNAEVKKSSMLAVCENISKGDPCEKCQACKKAASEADTISAAYVHRVRNSALDKMRRAEEISDKVVCDLMAKACAKHGCAESEVLGPKRVGPCVKARVEFFCGMFRFGFTVEEMAGRTGFDPGRISLCIERASLSA